MSSILFNLPEFYNAYKSWISKNPQQASDCEVTVKWISYFIAGRINSSHLMSELVYCLSNLLVFFNDRIIIKAKDLEIRTPAQTLKLYLTVMEYSEVFLELSAKKLWGSTGRWLMILVIQISKCIGRLLLVYHHKESIVQTPPIPVLDRREVDQKDSRNCNLLDNNLNAVSFKLKRSGRVVRKVEGSPPIAFRAWKPLQPCIETEGTKNSSGGQKLFAETIYILKPIAHLASLRAFGESSWKPWIISLAMDASSLHLYKSYQRQTMMSLSPKQRLQLSKRTVILVLYLIKSPFYDKYSKDKVYAFLNALGKYVPLANLICTPLVHYLPFWQSTYFYLWST